MQILDQLDEACRCAVPHEAARQGTVEPRTAGPELAGLPGTLGMSSGASGLCPGWA